jgi:hypothetical protein
VVLSATDIVPSLQTGMIDCVTTAPLYVLTARLFDRARYMQDVAWGFIYGATIVRSDAWERIPADLRPRLKAIAEELGLRVDAEVQRLNDDAVSAMKKQGLEVVKVDPAAWRPALERPRGGAGGRRAGPVLRRGQAVAGRLPVGPPLTARKAARSRRRAAEPKSRVRWPRG